jgi:hypothetical protein
MQNFHRCQIPSHLDRKTATVAFPLMALNYTIGLVILWYYQMPSFVVANFLSGKSDDVSQASPRATIVLRIVRHHSPLNDSMFTSLTV